MKALRLLFVVLTTLGFVITMVFFYAGNWTQGQPGILSEKLVGAGFITGVLTLVFFFAAMGIDTILNNEEEKT